MRIKDNLMESILKNLNESSINDYMSENEKQMFNDIVNSYSSSHNHLKYKIGDSMNAVFENGIEFKFIKNDDGEYEYYVHNNSGKSTKPYLMSLGLSDEARDFETNVINESEDNKFKYMMLSRLQSDCDYFLGNGECNARNLYYHDIKRQCDEMRKLYNSFADEDKPEWISLEIIDKYEEDMLNYENNGEYSIKNPTVINDIEDLHEGFIYKDKEIEPKSDLNMDYRQKLNTMASYFEENKVDFITFITGIMSKMSDEEANSIMTKLYNEFIEYRR